MGLSCHREHRARGGASTNESLSWLPSLSLGPGPAREEHQGGPGHRGPVTGEALSGLEGSGLSCSGHWGLGGLL